MQYLHRGDTHTGPAVTQSFVSGQQISVSPQAVVLADGSHVVLVGVKHFLASGQQYSVGLHTLGQLPEKYCYFF